MCSNFASANIPVVPPLPILRISCAVKIGFIAAFVSPRITGAPLPDNLFERRSRESAAGEPWSPVPLSLKGPHPSARWCSESRKRNANEEDGTVSGFHDGPVGYQWWTGSIQGREYRHAEACPSFDRCHATFPGHRSMDGAPAAELCKTTSDSLLPRAIPRLALLSFSFETLQGVLLPEDLMLLSAVICFLS